MLERNGYISLDVFCIFSCTLAYGTENKLSRFFLCIQKKRLTDLNMSELPQFVRSTGYEVLDIQTGTEF